MSSALGSRIFWSARAWVAVALWTLAYSDGAGFGSVIYQNNCAGSPLFYQSLFPPDVSIGTFLATAATIWVNGVYQSGITLGFMVFLIVMAIGSRLNGYVLERVLSIPVIVIIVMALPLVGYAVVVNATLDAGNSPCAL